MVVCYSFVWIIVDVLYCYNLSLWKFFGLTFCTFFGWASTMPWDFWNEYSVCIFVQCFFFFLNLWVSSHVETCLATEGLCDQAAHLVSLVVLECLGARVESHWANPSDNLDAEKDMVVSWNRGYPKSSSILMGFSIKNQPFWIPPFMETPILLTCSILFLRLLIVMWVTTHQLGSGIRTIWKRCICLTTSSLKLVLPDPYNPGCNVGMCQNE